MARVTPTEYAEKWGRRLKGSTEDIRRGVNNVTVAPGEAAAKQIELMKANLMKSLEDGTWEAAVKRVGLDEWKKSFIDKGLGRISAGVDGAQGKQVQMAEKLLAAVDESVSIVNRQPRGTLEDNINRMTTYAREMNKRKLKKA
jgi:hypothetical protein